MMLLKIFLIKEKIHLIIVESHLKKEDGITFIEKIRKRFGRDFLNSIPDIGYKIVI